MVARPLLYSIVIYLIIHHVKQFVWFIGSHCGWVQNSVASATFIIKKVEQSMYAYLSVHKNTSGMIHKKMVNIVTCGVWDGEKSFALYPLVSFAL